MSDLCLQSWLSCLNSNICPHTWLHIWMVNLLNKHQKPKEIDCFLETREVLRIRFKSRLLLLKAVQTWGKLLSVCGSNLVFCKMEGPGQISGHCPWESTLNLRCHLLTNCSFCPGASGSCHLPLLGALLCRCFKQIAFWAWSWLCPGLQMTSYSLKPYSQPHCTS